MRRYPPLKLAKDDIVEVTVPNFAGGVNKLVSDTHIQNNELSDALNIEITEDGVIKKRRGSSLKLTQGSRITGQYFFAKSDGTKMVLFTSGQALYKTTDLVTATRIGSATQFTTTLRTNFAQYNDFVYICNGTDAMAKTDGSTITTFTSVADPGTGPTVTQNGTTGTTTYGYRYTYVTAVGETGPSPEITITNGNATLTSTNNVSVAIPGTIPAGATGVNIYGRKAGKETWMKLIEQSSGAGPTFTDDGSITPSTFFGVPRGNNTAGQKGKFPIVYRDSLFLFGDPDAKTRLHYSGGGDKFDSFLVSDGGGFIDVNRSGQDGIGTGGIVWQDKLIVTKERSVWQFTFSSTGSPSLAVIQPLHGCVDHRTICMVENDVLMLSQVAGKLAIMTLGFEPNFFNVIRTNQVSVKAAPLFDALNLAQITNASAEYYDYKYILSAPEGTSTTNNVCLVYDRRYNAQLGRWDGITANGFVKFIDSTGNEILLYGSDASGGLVQLLTGTDDSDTAISFSATTKNFQPVSFNLSNWFVDAFFQLRNLTGTLTIGKFIETSEGQVTTTAATQVTQNTGTQGWGAPNTWGSSDPWGTSTGSSASTSASSLPIRMILNREGRGMKFEFTNDGLSDSVALMGMLLRARPRTPEYFPSSLTIT